MSAAMSFSGMRGGAGRGRGPNIRVFRTISARAEDARSPRDQAWQLKRRVVRTQTRSGEARRGAARAGEAFEIVIAFRGRPLLIVRPSALTNTQIYYKTHEAAPPGR